MKPKNKFSFLPNRLAFFAADTVPTESEQAAKSAPNTKNKEQNLVNRTKYELKFMKKTVAQQKEKPPATNQPTVDQNDPESEKSAPPIKPTHEKPPKTDNPVESLENAPTIKVKKTKDPSGETGTDVIFEPTSREPNFNELRAIISTSLAETLKNPDATLATLKRLADQFTNNQLFKLESYRDGQFFNIDGIPIVVNNYSGKMNISVLDVPPQAMDRHPALAAELAEIKNEKKAAIAKNNKRKGTTVSFEADREPTKEELHGILADSIEKTLKNPNATQATLNNLAKEFNRNKIGERSGFVNNTVFSLDEMSILVGYTNFSTKELSVYPIKMDVTSTDKHPALAAEFANKKMGPSEGIAS